MNIHAIASAAAIECERQHVGIERLWTLIRGYEYASSLSPADITMGSIAILAGIVEPDNGGVYRKTPVTFANGGTAANAADVVRLVSGLIVHGNDLTVDEWIKEFLWIHPFTDGNGRTAWVLYNFKNGTMNDPVALPDFFG